MSRQLPPEPLYLHNPLDILTDVARGISPVTGETVLLTGQTATCRIAAVEHGAAIDPSLAISLTEIGATAAYGGTISRAAVNAALAAYEDQVVHRVVRIGDYEWSDPMLVTVPRPTA